MFPIFCPYPAMTLDIIETKDYSPSFERYEQYNFIF